MVDEPSKPYRRPARLIGMSGLKYRSMLMRSQVDFAMEHTVPDAVLQGSVEDAMSTPFLKLERPGVRIVKSVPTATLDRTSVDPA